MVKKCLTLSDFSDEIVSKKYNQIKTIYYGSIKSN